MVIYISCITICWCLNHLKNLQKGAWLNHATAGWLSARDALIPSWRPLQWDEDLVNCFLVATQVGKPITFVLGIRWFNGFFHGDLMVISWLFMSQYVFA